MVGVAEIITSKGMLGNAVHMTVFGRLANALEQIEDTIRKVIEIYSSVYRTIEISSASLNRFQ